MEIYALCVTVGMLLMAAAFAVGVIVSGVDKAERDRDRNLDSDSE